MVSQPPSSLVLSFCATRLLARNVCAMTKVVGPAAGWPRDWRLLSAVELHVAVDGRENAGIAFLVREPAR